jgi:myo-inositol-1(or 4)-monophosphatase
VPDFIEELLSVAVDAAQLGAEVAMDWRRRAAELTVEEKAGPGDLVSQADRETEESILARIASRRPGDAVLGEEGGLRAGSSGVRWAVDPIDGTTSYLYGREDWAVSVAAIGENDQLLAAVVLEPAAGFSTEAGLGMGTRANGRRIPALAHDDLSRALLEVNIGKGNQRLSAGAMIGAVVPFIRDVRRGGSAASALAAVASGRADAAWLPGLNLWDCAAGALLVAEAGGVVGDLVGPNTGYAPVSGDVLATSPALWPVLHGLIAPAYAASHGDAPQ